MKNWKLLPFKNISFAAVFLLQTKSLLITRFIWQIFSLSRAFYLQSKLASWITEFWYNRKRIKGANIWIAKKNSPWWWRKTLFASQKTLVAPKNYSLFSVAGTIPMGSPRKIILKLSSWMHYCSVLILFTE